MQPVKEGKSVDITLSHVEPLRKIMHIVMVDDDMIEPYATDIPASSRHVQFAPDAKDCPERAFSRSDPHNVKINLKRDWGNPKGNKKTKVTRNDQRSALQHIAKNTTQGMVDLEIMSEPLKTILGSCSSEIKYAFVVYKPKLERIPFSAEPKEWLRSIVTLTKDGEFHISPWANRPPSADRQIVTPTKLALFAYRDPACQAVPTQREEHVCQCCIDCDLEGVDISHNGENGDMDLEALYEEVDWTEPNVSQLPQETLISSAKIFNHFGKLVHSLSSLGFSVNRMQWNAA